MKVAISLIGLCFSVTLHSSAQTNRVARSIDSGDGAMGFLAAASPKPEGIPDEIMTREGLVYKNIRIERVDPSGLTVSHAMAGGGVGLTKIAFAQLPHDLQVKYGYDPQAAAKFESDESQANAQWAARMAADEQAAKITIAEREQRELEAERQAAELAEAERKMKAEELAAQAAMFQATNPPPALNNTGGHHHH